MSNILAVKYVLNSIDNVISNNIPDLSGYVHHISVCLIAFVCLCSICLYFMSKMNLTSIATPRVRRNTVFAFVNEKRGTGSLLPSPEPLTSRTIRRDTESTSSLPRWASTRSKYIPYFTQICSVHTKQNIYTQIQFMSTVYFKNFHGRYNVNIY